jgi:hypothetical protein
MCPCPAGMFTDNSQRNIYEKGLVAEVSQFLFGDGFAISGGEAWKARRRAVGPSLHRCVAVGLQLVCMPECTY